MARGVVKRVIDGDTFEIRSGKRIRLAGVDAPELSDPGGEAARRRLQRLLQPGTAVGLSETKALSYGRTVRNVTVGGKDLSDKLTNKPKTKR